jgi:hypothetical protein
MGISNLALNMTDLIGPMEMYEETSAEVPARGGGKIRRHKIVRGK